MFRICLRRTGIDKLDLFFIVHDKLVSHKKLHMLCRSGYEEYRNIVKYVCEYYYGEEGVRAFEAHWNLDKNVHIATQISESLDLTWLET